MHHARLLTVTTLAISIFITMALPLEADNKPVSRFPAQTEWGHIVARPSALELHVDRLPDNRTISFPRLNNRMKSVYIAGQTEKESRLKFKPEITTWEITLPEELDEFTGVIVFQTLEPIKLALKPYVIQQSENGIITLPAHHVVTHGKLLRYEPQPHKNTLGYWANADDWAEWHVSISSPGQFEVEILQGCGKGQGGSIVEIEFTGSRCRFEIEDTGHFQNFKRRNVGIIDVTGTGTFPLKIRTINKAKAAACDIRQIRLLPVAR